MVQKEGDRGDSVAHGLPVSKVVDPRIPTTNQLLDLLARIRHPNNGAVNPNCQEIRDAMEAAERDDSDVVLLPRSQHTEVIVGRWLADNKRLVAVTAGTALTAAVVAGALGFVLRSHHREAPK